MTPALPSSVQMEHLERKEQLLAESSAAQPERKIQGFQERQLPNKNLIKLGGTKKIEDSFFSSDGTP
eukprot:CAMPEP_0194348656 /NCGR_PEP_ID=MMETSP0171-20130528/106648_1 /TAXON_ID=218684 /ORGANISM="Corethron pennatum, Strain L29A3" /LENGTH=66 /DNA_ID=CAMNT_0039116013 /DNA_START=1785 /DNA_END=1985 /DNA_ORIENTATION=+